MTDIHKTARTEHSYRRLMILEDGYYCCCFNAIHKLKYFRRTSFPCLNLYSLPAFKRDHLTQVCDSVYHVSILLREGLFSLWQFYSREFVIIFVFVRFNYDLYMSWFCVLLKKDAKQAAVKSLYKIYGENKLRIHTDISNCISTNVT